MIKRKNGAPKAFSRRIRIGRYEEPGKEGKGEADGGENMASKAMLTSARGEPGFHEHCQLLAHLASFEQDRI